MTKNPTASGRKPRPAPAPRASASALTPKDILGMLRRHLWLIFLMTLFGALAGAGGWYLVRRYLPLYRAETALQVLPPVETDPMEIVTTQVQQDIQYGHRVAVANLIRSQNSLVDLLNSDKVRSTKWFRRYVGSDTEGEDQADPAKIVKAVRYLEKNLTAFPHREADQILLSMTCGSPTEAALIVNEMARLFVSRHGESKREELSKRLIELTSQQSAIEGQIAASERDLQRLRESSGITDLEQPAGRYFQHTITLGLNDLQLQENELMLAVKQLRADVGNLKALAEGPITEQVEYAIERDPVMVSLAEQLVLLQAQLSGRLTKFGPGHATVRQTQEQIVEIEAKRNQRKSEIAEQTRLANLYNARDTLRVLEERLSELQRMRSEAQKQQEALDQARISHEQIVQKRDERIEVLNQIKAQIEKVTLMLNDPETPKVQRLREAPPPLEMVLSRHILLWIPGGTVLGLMTGLGLALLLETLNDLVRTPSDVRRFLHLPLLGVVPDADEDRAVDDVDLCHVVRQAPYSLLGESYRRCRTNIDLAGEAGPKTLLVASGNPSDGKTSLACNLAEAFVAKHEKVLLIDANLRQPRLHLVFPRGASEASGERRPGLTSLLLGQCAVNEAIHPSGIEGLHLIYAGPATANPADLLAGQAMRELIQRVPQHYDRVVIDSPPVLLVSDVKMLARLTDATLLVFNATATRRGAAQRTIFELHEVGANVIGCVLFGAEAIKGGYFRREFKAYRKYLKPQLAANSA
ncbi:MAG: polysaccharide biosynthesis tyrosine autokinase [Sedimentisphaerales bacterium]|nr:polysaccharide biosynthesis tyrosine autokinase [Sedimentisphaerales bacterium]